MRLAKLLRCPPLSLTHSVQNMNSGVSMMQQRPVGLVPAAYAQVSTTFSDTPDRRPRIFPFESVFELLTRYELSTDDVVANLTYQVMQIRDEKDPAARTERLGKFQTELYMALHENIERGYAIFAIFDETTVRRVSPSIRPAKLNFLIDAIYQPILRYIISHYQSIGESMYSMLDGNQLIDKMGGVQFAKLHKSLFVNLSMLTSKSVDKCFFDLTADKQSITFEAVRFAIELCQPGTALSEPLSGDKISSSKWSLNDVLLKIIHKRSAELLLLFLRGLKHEDQLKAALAVISERSKVTGLLRHPWALSCIKEPANGKRLSTPFSRSEPAMKLLTADRQTQMAINEQEKAEHVFIPQIKDSYASPHHHRKLSSDKIYLIDNLNKLAQMFRNLQKHFVSDNLLIGAVNTDEVNSQLSVESYPSNLAAKVSENPSKILGLSYQQNSDGEVEAVTLATSEEAYIIDVRSAMMETGFGFAGTMNFILDWALSEQKILKVVYSCENFFDKIQHLRKQLFLKEKESTRKVLAQFKEEIASFAEDEEDEGFSHMKPDFKNFIDLRKSRIRKSLRAENPTDSPLQAEDRLLDLLSGSQTFDKPIQGSLQRKNISKHATEHRPTSYIEKIDIFPGFVSLNEMTNRFLGLAIDPTVRRSPLWSLRPINGSIALSAGIEVHSLVALETELRRLGFKPQDVIDL